MNEKGKGDILNNRDVKLISGLLLLFVIFSVVDAKLNSDKEHLISSKGNASAEQDLAQIVIPEKGVVLPITWGDLGKQMVAEGVIDQDKFESLYAGRGGLSEKERELLYGKSNQKITINRENSGFILNFLWAFGLSNKNDILENGEMTSVQYGGDAGRFASTGGFSLSVGNSMDHYSAHKFVTLSPEEQKRVLNVSKGIYRPCCGNSTHFPDCNHGMAMLGLLELLVDRGLSETEMYETALSVNSYWFPDTYLTLAGYFEMKGVPWGEIDPEEILSEKYSSSQGYKRILTEINPVQNQGGGGCSA